MRTCSERVAILMVHPRLNWGDVENDFTPALLELPASGTAGISASRIYASFNQNGWAGTRDLSTAGAEQRRLAGCSSARAAVP